MAEPRASGSDPLTQLVLQNPPRSVAEMRRMLDGIAGLLNAALPRVGALYPGVEIEGAGGTGIPADVVVPEGAGPHPVLVYLHGGGWICGSPATHRKLAHRFAEAGILVVSVDYRLAPEHPFPVPLDDCLAALRWTGRSVERFGGDPGRLALGGDSAGANLAAAAALAGEPEGPPLRALLLLYGVYDLVGLQDLVASSRLPAEVVGLGAELVEMMVGAYLGALRSPAVLRDPRVSPLYAAAKLPPAHLLVGTADPLLEQSRALGRALEAAGVEHESFEDEGMPHGYAQLEFLSAARPAIERMIRFLQRKLAA